MWSSSTGSAPFSFFLPPLFLSDVICQWLHKMSRAGSPGDRRADGGESLSERQKSPNGARRGKFRRMALKRLEGTEQKSDRLSPRRASVRKRRRRTLFFKFPYTPWFAALSLERTEAWDLICPVKIKIPARFLYAESSKLEKMPGPAGIFCQRDQKRKKTTKKEWWRSKDASSAGWPSWIASDSPPGSRKLATEIVGEKYLCNASRSDEFRAMARPSAWNNNQQVFEYS